MECSAFFYGANQSWDQAALDCLILKIKALLSIKTSVGIYQSTGRNVPGDWTLKILFLMRLEVTLRIWNFIYICFEILQLEFPFTHTSCAKEQDV